MEGPNQHYIPKFLQKGFAIPKTRAKKIWVWAETGGPDEGIIKRTASEDWFYSGPSGDGGKTLDGQITDLETPLALEFHRLRDLDAGSTADPAVSAKVVLHFSSRTAHLRGTMESGITKLADGASAILDDPDNLARLMGLQESEPTEKFREMIGQELQKHFDPATTKVPKEIVERIIFFMAKENFSTLVDGALPNFRHLFELWSAKFSGLARDGHNQALERVLNSDDNARVDYLAGLDWRIEASPPEGAILPDCVVLSFSEDGRSGPFMHMDRDDADIIVMPISSQKLLVGTPTGKEVADLGGFNVAAARSSHAFFLSGSDDEQIRDLQALIGTRSTAIIDEAVNRAFQDYMPVKPEAVADDGKSDEPILGDLEGEQWTYQLSLIGFGTQDYAEKVVARLKQIVEPMARVMPLHRLEGITFAINYVEALQSVDTGFPDSRPIETVDIEDAQGIAKTITVLRDGELKAHIVFNALVLHHLLKGETQDTEWAIRVIVSQLAMAAMIEWIETALPGAQTATIEGQLQSWLYSSSNPALHSYVGSYVSAGFGDTVEIAKASRSLLIEAINRIQSVILPARLAYRYDGDLDLLLTKTLPVIQQILMFAANLLGHCSASGENIMDEDGLLEEALLKSDLDKWFPLFHGDLEQFRQNLARWKSFDEFLALNVHVERLFWQVGMIPWETDDQIHLEIPLESDAAELMANQV